MAARNENESADVAQMRAELALLRALVQDANRREEDRAKDKEEVARYAAWIGLSAAEKTQRVCEKLYPPLPGEDWWEVELREQPRVRLPAHSEFEAVGRYNQLCGILSTEHKHTVARAPLAPPAAAGAA